MTQPLCEALLHYLFKLKMGQPFDLAVPLVGYTLNQKSANCILEAESGPLFDFVSSLIGTQPCRFVYVLSVAAVVL